MLTPADRAALRALCRDEAAYEAALDLLKRTQDRRSGDGAGLALDDSARSQPLLASVLDSSFDGIMAFEAVRDAAGTLVDFTWTTANQQSATITGRAPDTLLGRRLLAEMPGNREAGLFDAYVQVVETRVPYHTLIHYASEGLDHWIELTATPLGDGFSVTFRDVSAQKRQASVLQESEERFRQAFDHAAIGMALVSPEGRWVKVNRAVCRLVGYTEQELLASSFQDITHPDDLEADLAYVQQMLRGERATYQMEKRYYHKEGHVVWVLLSVSLVRTADGAPRYFISQIQDITARKASEVALHTQRQRLEMALLGGDLGTWDLDLDTGSLTVNERWHSMLGYFVGEIVPSLEFFERHVHPDDMAEAWVQFDRHAQGEVPLIEVELRVRHRNGSWLWILDRGQIVERAEDGTPKRAVGTHLDITERKEAAEAIREQKARLRMLVENTNTPIWSVDAHHRLTEANRGALRFLQSDYRFPVHVGDALLPPGSSSFHWDEPYAQAFQGQTVQLEHTVQIDGASTTMALTLCPVHGPDGAVHTVTVLGHDISEHRRLIRMKDEFVSTVSHELRTPLTSIHAALGLLAHQRIDLASPRAASVVEVAAKNSTRLVHLVNDILDIDRIEAGQMPMTMRPVSVPAILERAIEEIGPYNAPLGVTVSLQIPSVPTAPQVYVDEGRMVQVLFNLLSNAAKFSPRGEEICIYVQTPAPGRVRIAVEDVGPGIPEAYQPYVFDRFSQANSVHRRVIGGSGLGLSITKSLVEPMEGTLTFKTKEGQGTTFYVDLPLFAPDPKVA
ncbi:MAG: PAS domain S-box protein [Bacteroidota bacterium]